MLPLPSYDRQFITLFRFGSGYVRRHVAVNINAADYKDLETIAIEKAMLGMRVDMMPTLQDDDPLRSVIFPDAIGFKCPDLRINGTLWEVEKSFNSQKLNNLKHAVDEGSKQAHHVIILLSHNVEYSFLYRVAKGRFKDHENLLVIEFRYGGSYTIFKKEKQ